MKLNQEARDTLQTYGITQAEWARLNYLRTAAGMAMPAVAPMTAALVTTMTPPTDVVACNHCCRPGRGARTDLRKED